MTGGIVLTSRMTPETSFGQAVCQHHGDRPEAWRNVPQLHDRRAKRLAGQHSWRGDVSHPILSLDRRRPWPGGSRILHGESVCRRTPGLAPTGSPAGATAGPAGPHGGKPASSRQSRGSGSPSGRICQPRPGGRGDPRPADRNPSGDAGIGDQFGVRCCGGGASHRVRRHYLPARGAARGAPPRGRAIRRVGRRSPERLS